MNDSTQSSVHTSTLRIEGEFSIYRAIELKQALFTEPLPVEIDLSAVTEIDTVGVQLLILAKKTALAQNRELRLVAHSPSVTEVFELLDLAAYFDDPLVMDQRTGASANRTARSDTERRTHES